MNNESKTVELLSEMLRKFDVLAETVGYFTGRVENLADTVGNRLGKVESEIMKLNLISTENSRALLKVSNEYNERIIR